VNLFSPITNMQFRAIKILTRFSLIVAYFTESKKGSIG